MINVHELLKTLYNCYSNTDKLDYDRFLQFLILGNNLPIYDMLCYGDFFYEDVLVSDTNYKLIEVNENNSVIRLYNYYYDVQFKRYNENGHTTFRVLSSTITEVEPYIETVIKFKEI